MTPIKITLINKIENEILISNSLFDMNFIYLVALPFKTQKRTICQMLMLVIVILWKPQSKEEKLLVLFTCVSLAS